MKLLPLLVLVAGAAGAWGKEPGPWGEAIMGRIVSEGHLHEQRVATVDLAMRQSSTQVAESNLAEEADNGCFHRTACAVGTVAEPGSSVDVPHLSMAQGILNFRNMLQVMATQAEEQGMPAEMFPNIKKTLASFAVGSTTGDLRLCDQLFHCPNVPATNLLREALASSADKNSFPDAQGRTTCAATGALCPGVSISCALCAIFLPAGTCGNQCIVAAIYCGTAGYACAHEAAQEEEETMPYRSPAAAGDKDPFRPQHRRFLFGHRRQ